MARRTQASLEERDRQHKALELRLAGRSFEQIADELGYYDKSTAWRAVHKLVDRHEAESVAELRAVDGARIERLLQAVWGSALGGDVAAVREARKLIDSHIRLFGLGKLDELAARQAELDEMQAMAVVTVMRAFAVALGKDPDDEEVRTLIHRQILSVAGVDPTTVVDGEVDE